MNALRASLILCSVTLLACPKNNASEEAPTGNPSPPTAEVPPPAPPPPPPAEPQPTASTEAPKASAWIGTWLSKGCGERKYPRKIIIAEGGAITGQELISPCPPKVACVWSGIINWKGSYEVKGAALALSIDEPDANPAMAPLPSSLRWEGAPAEEAGCKYEAQK